MLKRVTAKAGPGLDISGPSLGLDHFPGLDHIPGQPWKVIQVRRPGLGPAFAVTLLKLVLISLATIVIPFGWLAPTQHHPSQAFFWYRYVTDYI